jgi:hypothetical protein
MVLVVLVVTNLLEQNPLPLHQWSSGPLVLDRLRKIKKNLLILKLKLIKMTFCSND